VKTQWFITFLLLFLAWPAFGDERLCAAPAKPTAGEDDLRMTEGEFTLQKYQESLTYLRKELPARLHALPSGSDPEQIDGFWLSYFNSLTFVEGYTLKTSALLERSRSGGKSGGPAERRFCAWLKKQQYVD
jgi:hypothetical protein